MRDRLSCLLAAAGFEVRGTRFQCQCPGGSRFTGSFSESKGVAFCHRCHFTATTRDLARRRGVNLPERRIGRAQIMRSRFRKWLNAKVADMTDQERRLARRAELAKAALVSFPHMDAAWNVLAEWYHVRRTHELFWESARDKVGRYWLYRAWRKAC